MTNATIKGLAELQAALLQLSAKLEQNVMRGALRAGAKVIMEEAQRTAAFVDRSGALRDSMRVTTGAKNGRVSGFVKVGPGKKKRGKGKANGKGGSAFYARFVEFGTAAHVIRARSGSMLAVGFSLVNHPGARKHPFLRPAIDTKATAAAVAAGEYIRQRLASKYGIDVPAPTEDGDE